jgi:hypothetical protein
MPDIPLKDIIMLSGEEASIQNTCEKLDQKVKTLLSYLSDKDIYLSDISSVNLRQIWVFPIPPIPQRRQERLDLSLLLAR